MHLKFDDTAILVTLECAGKRWARVELNGTAGQGLGPPQQPTRKKTWKLPLPAAVNSTALQVFLQSRGKKKKKKN